MKFLKLFIPILFVLLLVPSVFAGVTFTSITYDDSTADVGTSRTVSIAMRTSSSSESVTATDISLSGGLTAVSSPSTPFTITYTPVTKTFTVRSDTAGTYSFSITVVDSSGNSYSSSSDLGSKTLEYVNPSSLTLTTMESPSGTYNKSGTTNKFGIVIRLQNSLDSTQTRNLTLYFDTSGFTVTGDTQSAVVSLSPGQTEKIWNTTIGTSVSDGTHYAYIRLGDNTAAATYPFTVAGTGGTTSTTQPGGGSGATTTTTTTSTSTTTTSTSTTTTSTTTTTTVPSTTTTIIPPFTIPEEIGGVVTWKVFLIIGIVIAVGVIVFLFWKGVIRLPQRKDKWKNLYRKYGR